MIPLHCTFDVIKWRSYESNSREWTEKIIDIGVVTDIHFIITSTNKMTNFWNLQEEKWLTIGVIYGCNTGTNKERKHGNPGKIINVFHFPGEKRHPDELENYLKLDCLAFDELRKTICRKRPFSMRLIAFTINDDKILIVFLIKNSSKNKPSFIRTKSNRTFEIVWGHDTAVSIIGLWGARYCSIDYWSLGGTILQYWLLVGTLSVYSRTACLSVRQYQRRGAR